MGKVLISLESLVYVFSSGHFTEPTDKLRPRSAKLSSPRRRMGQGREREGEGSERFVARLPAPLNPSYTTRLNSTQLS